MLNSFYYFDTTRKILFICRNVNEVIMIIIIKYLDYFIFIVYNKFDILFRALVSFKYTLRFIGLLQLFRGTVFFHDGASEPNKLKHKNLYYV